MSTPKLTKLTGPQFEKWLNAFVAAFDMDSLREMLRTKLGERLDTISKDGNMRVVVLELLDWAERTGNLNRLLDGVVAAVPGNAALQALIKKVNPRLCRGDARSLTNPGVV